MTSILKKLGLAIIALLIIGIIWIELNKEKVVQKAIDSFSDRIEGQIAYEDVGVTFISSLPKIGLTLDNFRITPNDSNEDLFFSEQIKIKVSLLDYLKKGDEIRVRGIDAKNALLNLKVHKDGTTNYNIYKSGEASSSQSQSLQIDQINISRSQIKYISTPSKLSIELKDFEYNGSLNHSDQEIKSQNKLTTDLNITRWPILKNYALKADSDFDLVYNLEKESINIIDQMLHLNDLHLSSEGQINLSKESYQFNFKSDKSQVKEFASLIPAYYKNDYNKLKSDGIARLNIDLTGKSFSGQPDFNFDFTINQGSLFYPELKQRISNIDIALKGNSHSNSSIQNFDLGNLNFDIGDSHFKGSGVFKQDKNSKDLIYDIDSDVDLSDIQKSISFSEGTLLRGRSAIVSSGTVENELGEEPKITIDKAKVFAEAIEIKNGEFQLNTELFSLDNNSNVSALNINKLETSQFSLEEASGTFQNLIPSLIDQNNEAAGNFSARFLKIDLRSSEDTSSQNIDVANFPKFKFAHKLSIDTILHDSYTIGGIEIEGTSNNKNINGSYALNNIEDNSISGSVDLYNYINYGLNGDTLTGTIELVSKAFNLDPFMEETEASTKDTVYAALIPKNLNVDIIYKTDELLYNDINISKALGDLYLRDGQVIFKNEGNLFEGKVVFSGTLSPIKNERHNIDLTFELKDLAFSKTAKTIPFFKKLLPLADLIKGKYTSSLNWNSDLDGQYMPDLNSLSALGELETKDGRISTAIPIDTFLSRWINFDKDESLILSDSRKYFAVEKGKVIVRNVDFSKGRINGQLEGKHGFDQSLDYKISLNVPKSLLKESEVLDKVQKRISFSKILKQVSDQTELVFDLHMGGTISQPIFKLTGIGLKDGDVKEDIKEAVEDRIVELRDSIKTEITDTINQTKDEILSKIDSVEQALKDAGQEVKDSLKMVLDTTISSLDDLIAEEQEELKEQGTSLLDSILSGNTDSLHFKIEDILKSKGQKLDSLKKKLPGLGNGLRGLKGLKGKIEGKIEGI